MPKILIIEDYQSLLKIYEEEFKAHKFSVVLASNGDEGLRIALAEQFDVILLDLLMPQSDGFDFLRNFDIAKHPHTKVIILSNVYSMELVNKALTLGASQYLLKSDVTPERILEIVQQTLAEDKETKT